MELSKEFKFEAAHMLPKHPGKCRFLHGHSWKLTVSVQGEINPETGFVIDYAQIKSAVQPIIDTLDHHFLGAWTDLFYKPLLERHSDQLVYHLPEDFYPSSENLINWIAWEIGDKLDSNYTNRYGQSDGWSPKDPSVPFDGNRHYWSRLELDETCTSKCILTREEYETFSRSILKGVQEEYQKT